MRSRLLLSAALPLILAAPGAWATEISDARTTPVSTATADNGAPDDISITQSGSVRPTEPGPAVRINSSNSVDNAGTIGFMDVDGAIGVLVEGGHAGGVTHRGQIVLDETYRRPAEGGPTAEGNNRVGILVEGPAPFTGDVAAQVGSQIAVRGNDSAAIRVAGDATLDGRLYALGTVIVAGDRSVGVDVQGDVTGRVETAGAITVVGEGSRGVVLAGGAEGFQNSGSVTATGFTSITFSDYVSPEEERLGVPLRDFNEDDLLTGGPAVAVGASLAEGFYNSGPVPAGTTSEAREEFNPQRVAGAISSFGSAPAVLISPDVNPDGTGTIVIGPAVETVRVTEDGEVVEHRFQETHGLVNRGTITGNGFNRGFDGSALVIAGSEDGTRGVVVQGGILNTGVIEALGREANATAVHLGAGADAGRLDNTVTIRADIATREDHEGWAILIEDGAVLSELVNRGVIEVVARGENGAGYAIVDRSGTLLDLINSGAIRAVHQPSLAGETGAGRMVALDLSAATQGATVVQERVGDGTPSIQGDILFGSGDDRLEVQAGTVRADLIDFGVGSDVLLISGEDTVVTGTVTSTDGGLTIQVDEGRLALLNDSAVRVVSADIGEAGELRLSVSSAENADRGVAASGTVHFADGAVLATRLNDLLLEDREFILVSAADLQIDGTLDELVAPETGFLYTNSVERRAAGGEEQIVLTLNRKTAQELGMNPNQASMYEPAIEALAAQTQINQAFAALETGAEFYAAYNQLMPDFTGAPLYLIVANIDGATGAVGNRLDAVRLTHNRELSIWAQEFLYYVDRSHVLPGEAFAGHGFGFAAGIDRPWGPFGAMGANLAISTNQTSRIGSFDEPLQAYSASLGLYAGGAAGGLFYDLTAGAGFNRFDSERRVLIGTLDRRAAAEWNAWHMNASARVSYPVEFGRFQLTPAASLDYLRLNESGYSETGGGGGVDLVVSDRNSDMFAATALMTLTRRFGGPASWWAPGLRLGVRSETGSIGATEAFFSGFNSPFSLVPEGTPSTGLIVGFLVTGGTGFSSFGFNYDADIRDGFLRHVARVVVRMSF